MFRILLIEPHYDGSHKAFIDALAGKLEAPCDLLTLPGRKWKQRLRLGGIELAAQAGGLLDSRRYSALVCGSMLNLAELKGLEPRLAPVPSILYFHENQFAYPVRYSESADPNLASATVSSALAADRVVFNSEYNRQTFLQGAKSLAWKVSVPGLEEAAEVIAGKSVVAYPPIDDAFSDLGHIPRGDTGPPIILWNHRWEHDKDPESFFRTMTDLDNAGCEFRLAVVGQSYAALPDVFYKAKERLGRRLVVWGYQRSAAAYCRVLRNADIVVSTARHEFFGMSVMEAVAAGCRPLVPARLSFPELYPRDFLYTSRSDLLRKLKLFLRQGVNYDGWSRDRLSALAKPYTWEKQADNYRRLVDEVTADRRPRTADHGPAMA